MNWGYRIILIYVLFAAGILTLVFKSKNEKVDLVAPDYYAQEVAYQSRIQAMENVKHLSKPLEVVQTNAGIEFRFPNECSGKMEGQLHAYRPSDSNLDKDFSIDLNEAHTQIIPLHDLQYGLYTFKAEWKMNDTPYYAENAIVVAK